jgi:hypothetical protein
LPAKKGDTRREDKEGMKTEGKGKKEEEENRICVNVFLKCYIGF